MKFPTDNALRDVIERLPRGSEKDPLYRAGRHLEERERFVREMGSLPPEIRYRYWYRDRLDRRDYSLIDDADLDRALAAYPFPWAVGSDVGLNVLDPPLYNALVSDQIARSAPGPIFVREVRYRNPFGEIVAGVGTAEKAVKTTASVIETAATLGSRRKIARLGADVAEATLDDRIEDSRLDIELKREQLRSARIANERAEAELVAQQIANAQAMETLSEMRRQQALAEAATARGELDLADAIASIDPSEAAALVAFSIRPLELEQRREPDPSEDD